MLGLGELESECLHLVNFFDDYEKKFKFEFKFGKSGRASASGTRPESKVSVSISMLQPDSYSAGSLLPF